MPTANLSALALSMRASARHKPDTSVEYTLPRGLALRLVFTKGQYFKLRLSRKNIMPSPTEEQVIRRDFSVPQDAYRIEQREGDTRAISLSWYAPLPQP
jgi:hypothetical protein